MSDAVIKTLGINIPIRDKKQNMKRVRINAEILSRPGNVQIEDITSSSDQIQHEPVFLDGVTISNSQVGPDGSETCIPPKLLFKGKDGELNSKNSNKCFKMTQAPSGDTNPRIKKEDTLVIELKRFEIYNESGEKTLIPIEKLHDIIHDYYDKGWKLSRFVELHNNDAMSRYIKNDVDPDEIVGALESIQMLDSITSKVEKFK